MLSKEMNWIRAKDCYGLVEMEKGKLKRELISEFVKDFKWYLAFEIHFNWIGYTPCICKTNPITFKNWMIKKWEEKL